jgi:hypothetical protein
MLSSILELPAKLCSIRVALNSTTCFLIIQPLALIYTTIRVEKYTLLCSLTTFHDTKVNAISVDLALEIRLFGQGNQVNPLRVIMLHQSLYVARLSNAIIR